MQISQLLKMYENMLLIRLVEERIVAEYPIQPQQIRCPTHLSIGQEATAVGVCMALGDEDVVFSTHRCHAHYLAKGGDLDRMFAELFGKVTGCARGKGGSMHLVDPSVGMLGSSAIVAGSIPIAAGAALSFKLRKQPHVAVAFFGDGATEEGVFTETMATAALWKLPLILVCENNQYATLSHISSRQCSPIYSRARAYRMPGVNADGNNAQVVFEVANDAVRRARAGEGPTLLELATYRWLAHVGWEPDTGCMRRTAEELEHWKQKCPIMRLRNELLDMGVDQTELDVISGRIRSRLDHALQEAKQAPAPENNELLMHVGDEVENA